MIKRTLFAALAVAVTGLFGAAPAEAQDRPDYRFDLGFNGGFAWYTDMLDDDHLGENAEDVKFESGWLVGTQATFWPSQQFGIRGNAVYTERPLVRGSLSEVGREEANDIREDINVYSLSADLLFRPMAEGLNLAGTASMPFLALGVGAKYSDVAGDQALGSDHTGFTFNAGGEQWHFVEEWKPMGLVALGTDFRLSDNFGLRLELGDRFWDAPLRNADNFATNPDEDAGNVVHELYAQLGAHVLMGLEAPEVVAVTPAPPAPQPEPEPEPEPVEERIRVCVIDPDTNRGISTVNAIYLPETRDTMVVVNGTRRDFRTTVPNVTVANDANWFVRGEPLTLTYAPDATIEYTTWQSARMIEADRLTFLGTARGLPVYANTDDARTFRTDWEEARRMARTGDIDDILAQDAELAAQLEEVQYLYVPLQRTGCVFQTVRLVEPVEKK